MKHKRKPIRDLAQETEVRRANHRSRNRSPRIKPEYLERIQQLLPNKKDREAYLKILKQLPVRSIRCNKLKIQPQELKQRLEKNYNWKIKQPWKNYPEVMIIEGKYFQTNVSGRRGGGEKGGSLSVSSNKVGISENLKDLEPGELGRAKEHLLGYYYIQELASMLPIIALAPKEDEFILDLCAAPGSKTTQLAAEMQNTGTIIANEVSMGRLKILASNLERCGVTNTIITRKEGVALCKRLAKYNPEVKFDKILVDAPCSGEGTLRSTPKTYIMWNPKTITSLSRLQKQLFEAAFNILKKGGEIIYSTCTHAPEENEEIANWALETFKGKIEIQKIQLPIKCREGLEEWDPKSKEEENKEDFALTNSASGASAKGGEGGTAKSNKKTKFNKAVKNICRVWPHDNDTEGFFVSKFKKVKD